MQRNITTLITLHLLELCDFFECIFSVNYYFPKFCFTTLNLKSAPSIYAWNWKKKRCTLRSDCCKNEYHKNLLLKTQLNSFKFLLFQLLFKLKPSEIAHIRPHYIFFSALFMSYLCVTLSTDFFVLLLTQLVWNKNHMQLTCTVGSKVL